MMKHLLFTAALLGCLPAAAATINLTDITVNSVPTSTYLGHDNLSHVGGSIGSALFRRDIPGSGSGQFRTLFKMNEQGNEQGYNRAIPNNTQGNEMDSSTPGGFNHILRISDLAAQNTEGGFYIFGLDTNEGNGGGTDNYISLDMFSLYVGGATDPSPLPHTEATLGQLGTRVYTMATSDVVLIDAGLSTGSGRADIYVFVPTSLFAGFAPTSMVYLFAKHGNYAGDPRFTSNSGFEEWASITTAVPAFIPEPSSAALALLGTVLLARRRRA